MLSGKRCFDGAGTRFAPHQGDSSVSRGEVVEVHRGMPAHISIRDLHPTKLLTSLIKVATRTHICYLLLVVFVEMWCWGRICFALFILIYFGSSPPGESLSEWKIYGTVSNAKTFLPDGRKNANDKMSSK
eukprot:1391112-Amphidinium_carterae.1